MSMRSIQLKYTSKFWNYYMSRKIIHFQLIYFQSKSSLPQKVLRLPITEWHKSQWFHTIYQSIQGATCQTLTRKISTLTYVSKLKHPSWVESHSYMDNLSSIRTTLLIDVNQIHFNQWKPHNNANKFTHYYQNQTMYIRNQNVKYGQQYFFLRTQNWNTPNSWNSLIHTYSWQHPCVHKHFKN